MSKTSSSKALAPAPRARSRFPRPSPDPGTNLMIADIVLRGASNLLRRKVEQRIALATAETEEEARDALDGRTLMKTAALYGASRLATRSPAGLGVVVGALVIKSLYDRGKALERRKAARRQETP